jgi:hypothetical protein
MKRRGFLLGALALPAVTYFDMGASWRKHDNGLWMGIDRTVYPERLSGMTGPILTGSEMMEILKDLIEFRLDGYYGLIPSRMSENG